jgi:hypothetical protein
MFIPRHPVVENQFCSYGAQTGTSSAGVGGVVCYAGSVVYLDSTAANQEPIVLKMTSDQVPFGFAMQKVKTGYHQVHPTGFMMPGDLGSSDVIAQPDYDANGNIEGTKEAPLGVAHLGIWDTVHYTTERDAGTGDVEGTMVPGDAMYASVDEAKVTTGKAGETAAEGGRSNSTQVAVVMKGASTAKVQANVNNTTLYPIRIKLLV